MLGRLSFNSRKCTEITGPELILTNPTKIFPYFDPTCLRCVTEPATLLHSGRVPGCVTSGGVFRCFSVIFSLPMDPDHVTAMFGVLTESVKLPDSVTLAKYWLDDSFSWIGSQWVFYFQHVLKMEKICNETEAKFGALSWNIIGNTFFSLFCVYNYSCLTFCVICITVLLLWMCYFCIFSHCYYLNDEKERERESRERDLSQDAPLKEILNLSGTFPG